MTKLKLLAAAAVLSTVMVAPAMAQQYHRADGFMMPPFLGASCVAREREVD